MQSGSNPGSTHFEIVHVKGVLVLHSASSCCRIWDIECGASLRLLEGHDELVRCIRFDDRKIVSGAYDG